MRKIITIAALLALAGCVEGEGIGRVGSPAWLMTTSPEAQAARFEGRCATYGFTPGTAAMAQCIAEEGRGARADARERVRSINTTPRTVNCRSTSFGSSTNTTCY